MIIDWRKRKNYQWRGVVGFFEERRKVDVHCPNHARHRRQNFVVFVVVDVLVPTTMMPISKDLVNNGEEVKKQRG